MPNIILTSSFGSVAQELLKKGALPKEPQRVAFIATAGNVYGDRPWIEADRKALHDLGYTVTDVELEGNDAEHLVAALEPCDIIFVAGGNTTYLFEHAHASGFDTIVRDLLRSRIYVGSSAGSILAGPSVEPFVEEDLPDLAKDFVLHDSKGLHLVDYIVLPHYPKYAEPNDNIAEKFSGRYPFIKLTDDEFRLES